MGPGGKRHRAISIISVSIMGGIVAIGLVVREVTQLTFWGPWWQEHFHGK